MKIKISVGDKVCYKASFLRNIGLYTGEAHMRGVAVRIIPFPSCDLVEIRKSDGEFIKVLAANLSIVDSAKGIADE